MEKCEFTGAGQRPSQRPAGLGMATCRALSPVTIDITSSFKCQGAGSADGSGASGAGLGARFGDNSDIGLSMLGDGFVSCSLSTLHPMTAVPRRRMKKT